MKNQTNVLSPLLHILKTGKPASKIDMEYETGLPCNWSQLLPYSLPAFVRTGFTIKIEQTESETPSVTDDNVKKAKTS